MPNMEPMKTFTVGADTWEIVDGAAREELADARTGADGTEYNSAGEAMRESVNGINDDLEANYALQDGYYEMLTAGSADNLTGRGDGVGAEFIYRTAGGSADIADGVAKIQSVKGNTLVWNQLAHVNNRTSVTNHGITANYPGNGSVVVSGTNDGVAQSDVTAIQPGNVAVIAGHKYLLRGCPASNANEYALVGTNVGIIGSNTRFDYGNGVIITPVNSGTIGIIFSVYNAIEVNFTIYPQFFDLTRMFGAGNEPATVAEFEALFPETYYPYDAGSLLNVNMEGVRTVGFNQWDEEWELGDISASTGANVVSSETIRAKGMISVFPNTSYYFKAPTNGFVYFYDAENAFIGRSDLIANQVFTTLTNAHYMRFRMWAAYGTTYKNDICINLSWSGYRNGEYEPYWTQTREIDTAAYFPDGMKSAGSVYDELTATKAIKRVGVLDEDSQGWRSDAATLNAHGLGFIVIDVGNPATGFTDANIKSNIPIGLTLFADAEQREFATNGTSVFYRFPASANYRVADGLADMAANGAKAYIQIAEPVETEITPELNLTYKVSDFGTEEIVVAAGEQTAPVCMQIVYGLNAVDTIRRLPVEYISHKSFMQFMSAIESHFNVTITETYDSNNERYNYSIATNESGE